MLALKNNIISLEQGNTQVDVAIGSLKEDMEENQQLQIQTELDNLNQITDQLKKAIDSLKKKRNDRNKRKPITIRLLRIQMESNKPWIPKT